MEVGNAVRTGRLIKPDRCSQCGLGILPIEGHHDDYAKPLDVRWLCIGCHAVWHLHNEPLNGESVEELVEEKPYDPYLDPQNGPTCQWPRVVYEDPVDQFHEVAEPFLVGVGTPYECFVEPYVYAEMRPKV